MPEPDLERLLAGLHLAVAGQADWQTEWAEVERWLGAQSSLFSIVRPNQPPIYLSFPSISPDDAARYVAHYRRLDPYEGVAPGNGTSRVLLGHEVIDTADYLETEFYRDFVRTLPEPALHFLGVAHALPGSGQIRLGFQRRPGAAEFEPRDADRLRALLPYLVGLMIGWDTIRGLRERAEEQDQLSDAATDAVMLLRADGCVRQMNKAAGQLAARHALLARDGGGRPVLNAARLPASFTRVLRQVVAGGPAQMLIARNEAGPTVALTLCGPPPGSAGNASRACAAVLQLKDLQGPPRATATLQAGFGLTKAEAEVALMLAEGESLAAIADRRHVSLTTIRTQVRAVLDKTDARSLRDMVRLVNRL